MKTTATRTPLNQGAQAARAWLAAANFEVAEPANPFPRMSDEGRAWSAGYCAEVYRVFGDPDADAMRAERAFGC